MKVWRKKLLIFKCLVGKKNKNKVKTLFFKVFFIESKRKWQKYVNECYDKNSKSKNKNIKTWPISF